MNHSLLDKDWIGVLNGTTSNDKFNQFCDTVNEVLDQISPRKTVRISAKHRYIELWITKGLEKSSNTKMKLYRATLSANHTEADIMKYKHHRNLYNKLKRSAKEEYYRTKCFQFKQNLKKLWSLINDTIKKVKQRKHYPLHHHRWNQEEPPKRDC